MISKLFHIKINSSEDNMDKGFYTLMASGAHIVCLEDEQYIVPEKAINKLNEKDVKYIIVTKKEASNRKEVNDCD